MAFGKWKAVIEELRAQREESERAWALVRREQVLMRRQLEQGEQRFEEREQRLEREFQLNRRAYEEGMALCTQLVERHSEALDSAVDSFASAMTEMRADIRAQTNAVFRLIDRMDRLDGGTAAA